ncbi:hypothetical protein Mp_2g24930 [Marchantia polymorpha subsp. ruderalis]|uniref:Uncharacterized protein n=1 Tax=Marchantia polymorpha TaxID=3197 RepID=A0A2R6W1X6_MARPO|nr:hypothetical protein MARPO_0181s0004 [Marchantia polymorpha]BBN03622.1 hypothetical protein Mp_2g24930 [Marchantia polymorpha subsp. ruderalis]|eukprot:PTQ27853.1 hypothetical protein MARPO_0181s0004 [Marchantia polymorpha]
MSQVQHIIHSSQQHLGQSTAVVRASPGFPPLSSNKNSPFDNTHIARLCHRLPSRPVVGCRPPFLNTDARNGASDCGATAPHATAQTGSQTTQTQASTLGDLKMALSRYCNEPLGVNRLHQKSGAEARLFELVGTTRKLPAGEWRAQ